MLDKIYPELFYKLLNYLPNVKDIYVSLALNNYLQDKLLKYKYPKIQKIQETELYALKKYKNIKFHCNANNNISNTRLKNSKIYIVYL